MESCIYSIIMCEQKQQSHFYYLQDDLQFDTENN